MLGATPTVRSSAGGRACDAALHGPAQAAGLHSSVQGRKAATGVSSAQGLPEPPGGGHGASSSSEGENSFAEAVTFQEWGGYQGGGGPNSDGGSGGGWAGGGNGGPHGFGASGASDGDGIPHRKIAAFIIALAALLAFWRPWSCMAPQLVPHQDPAPWVVAGTADQHSGSLPTASGLEALTGAAAGGAFATHRIACLSGTAVGRRLGPWLSWFPLFPVQQLLHRPLGGHPPPDSLASRLRREQAYWAHKNPYGIWHGRDGWAWCTHGQAAVPPAAVQRATGFGEARSWPHSYPILTAAVLARRVPGEREAPGLWLPTVEASAAPVAGKPLMRHARARAGGDARGHGQRPSVSLRDEIAALAAVRDRLHGAHCRAEQWLQSRRADAGLA